MEVFFSVYASTEDHIRRTQWQILQERMSRCQEACLVIGDFNDILDAAEKVGGVPRTVRSMVDFRTFVTDNRLLDLGFMGYPFTWRNRRLDGGIQERLDRGLATDQWLYLYPDAKIHHLMAAGSDHVMLLLQTHGVPTRWQIRFIYDPRWNTNEGFRQVVKERWGKLFRGARSLQVVSKLQWVRKGILNWRRSEWRSSQVRIEALRGELCTAYQESNFDSARVRQMESDLKNALHEEEAYWKLKS